MRFFFPLFFFKILLGVFILWSGLLFSADLDDAFSEYLQDEYGLTEEEAGKTLEENPIGDSFEETLDLFEDDPAIKDAIEEATGGKTLDEIRKDPKAADLEAIFNDPDVLDAIDSQLGDSEALESAFSGIASALLSSYVEDYRELRRLIRVLAYRIGVGSAISSSLSATSGRIYTWNYKKSIDETSFRIYINTGVSITAGYINGVLGNTASLDNISIVDDGIIETEKSLERSFPEIGYSPSFYNFILRYYPKTVPKVVGNPIYWDIGFKLAGSHPQSFIVGLGPEVGMLLTTWNISGAVDVRINVSRYKWFGARVVFGGAYLTGRTGLGFIIETGVADAGGTVDLEMVVTNVHQNATGNIGAEFEFNLFLVKIVLAPNFVFNFYGHSLIEAQSALAGVKINGVLPAKVPIAINKIQIFTAPVDFQFGTLIQIFGFLDIYSTIYYPIGDLTGTVALNNDDVRVAYSIYMGFSFNFSP